MSSKKPTKKKTLQEPEFREEFLEDADLLLTEEDKEFSRWLAERTVEYYKRRAKKKAKLEEIWGEIPD